MKTAPLWLLNAATVSPCAVGADADDLREAGRVHRCARTVVTGSGDDDNAVLPRVVDRGLQRCALSGVRERHEDDAGAVVDRVHQSFDDVAVLTGAVVAENAHGHDGHAREGDARDARAVVRPTRRDRGLMGSMTVWVGSGVGAVEAPTAYDSTSKIWRVRVDTGVEHRDGRRPPRSRDSVNVFPADRGQRPLVAVGRVGRATHHGADLVEGCARDTRVVAVRELRGVDLVSGNADEVQTKRGDGARLDATVTRDGVGGVGGGESGDETDEQCFDGRGRSGCRRGRGGRTRRGGGGRGRRGRGRRRRGRGGRRFGGRCRRRRGGRRRRRVLGRRRRVGRQRGVRCRRVRGRGERGRDRRHGKHERGDRERGQPPEELPRVWRPLSALARSACRRTEDLPG